MLQEEIEEQRREVERPDAKDAADVEGGQVDSSGLGLFALEKFGDEVGTEQEEETDAEGT